MRGSLYLPTSMCFMMKMKLILGVFIAVLLAQFLINGCSGIKKEAGETAAKEYVNNQTDSLIYKLGLLDSFVVQNRDKSILQTEFAETRFAYKKIEAVVEYYFQGLTRRINGPALPDIKTEDGQVWPPHGFQVIEQFLYGGYHDSLQKDLSNEIKILQTDLRFVKSNMQHNAILPHHAAEIIQHQLIRIAALGITGFDAPLSQLSLPETISSLQGLNDFFIAYYGNARFSGHLKQQLSRSVDFINVNSDFESFDRLTFLTNNLMPLSESFIIKSPEDQYEDSLMLKPFRGTLSGLLQGRGFDGDYYATYANAKTNAAKLELGKQLFFDKNLSQSGTISCGSCHQPGLYFTDGKAKAGNFVHGGSLQRNTPTLYYAALQSNQFFDLRSVTLEDQADEVMKNSNEFNFTSSGIAQKLFADENYKALFTKAFDMKDSVSSYEVRNALAAFVRSLSPFTSRFDDYMKGNKKALNTAEASGFNLFMGKAKCGTCHFIPLFNGNIPPWYSKSESEIIGVPAAVIWNKATIDADSGRFKINRMKELMFAFKTPTVRNVEKTGPYMHNGIYKTLDEIVEFYHKGGGVGIGIELPFQSLPFDSLSLNKQEKQAIVAFMRSLTDNRVDH